MIIQKSSGSFGTLILLPKKGVILDVFIIRDGQFPVRP